MKEKVIFTILAYTCISMISSTTESFINFGTDKTLSVTNASILHEVSNPSIKKLQCDQNGNCQSNISLIDQKEIISVSSNGKSKQDYTIDKAFDNDLDTYWKEEIETSNGFNNQIVVEFSNVIKIDKIKFIMKLEDCEKKENATKIYSSFSGNYDDFTHVEGKMDNNNDLNSLEINLEPTEFKKLKVEIDLKMPKISEILFYECKI